jgi:hypothetical protein
VRTQAMTARQGSRAIARLDADLKAPAGRPRAPLAPGGRAAMPPGSAH